jgi:hypothetical protein
MNCHSERSEESVIVPLYERGIGGGFYQSVIPAPHQVRGKLQRESREDKGGVI